MKRYGLGAQYVSFWRAKRKVLNCETIPFAKQWACGGKIVKFIACNDSAKSGIVIRIICFFENNVLCLRNAQKRAFDGKNLKPVSDAF